MLENGLKSNVRMLGNSLKVMYRCSDSGLNSCERSLKKNIHSHVLLLPKSCVTGYTSTSIYMPANVPLDRQAFYSWSL